LGEDIGDHPKPGICAGRFGKLNRAPGEDQPGTVPQPLGEGLQDGHRTAPPQLIEQRVRLTSPPLVVHAVADDQDDLSPGRVHDFSGSTQRADGRGCAAQSDNLVLRVQEPDPNLPERAELLQLLVQVSDHGSPDGHRRSSVHDQREAEPPFGGRLERRQDRKPCCLVDGRVLIQDEAALERRHLPFQRPQRTADFLRVRQRRRGGGARPNRPATAGARRWRGMDLHALLGR
jgi:hypothetical protein